MTLAQVQAFNEGVRAVLRIASASVDILTSRGARQRYYRRPDHPRDQGFDLNSVAGALSTGRAAAAPAPTVQKPATIAAAKKRFALLIDFSFPDSPHGNLR